MSNPNKIFQKTEAHQNPKYFHFQAKRFQFPKEESRLSPVKIKANLHPHFPLRTKFRQQLLQIIFLGNVDTMPDLETWGKPLGSYFLSLVYNYIYIYTYISPFICTASSTIGPTLN